MISAKELELIKDEKEIPLHSSYDHISNIVRYLNREIGVHLLPDHIRNRTDALEEIYKWNNRIESKILKYKDGVYSQRAREVLGKYQVKFE